MERKFLDLNLSLPILSFVMTDLQPSSSAEPLQPHPPVESASSKSLFRLSTGGTVASLSPVLPVRSSRAARPPSSCPVLVEVRVTIEDPSGQAPLVRLSGRWSRKVASRANQSSVGLGLVPNGLFSAQNVAFSDLRYLIPSL
ncbi:hypothetical protein SCHPADRAFT_897267 [Schizopora paradoxa]|uniref:Uncharacterized protein n=1 Tax=Schizopora paradoxa TaxID=27342 RepID=A0A0H2QXN3_9AGAM|nr:hypothetical protein SCHPADRAFT_897267 [Schizopora paradoxa]